MKRRLFLAASLASAAGAVVARRIGAAEPQITLKTGVAKMSFQQPPLPYALDALKPFLSEEQMSYHYGKHHAAYFKKLNSLVEGKPEAQLTLEQVVLKSSGPVFNNAAQAWNHSFFWNCMKPGAGGEPKGTLQAAIERDFGSVADFKKAFSDAAASLFGSGWTWLAQGDDGKLEIMALSNADTPMRHGKRALLTLDVWEHAYYIDYRNERPKFIDGFWSVVNWDFAAKNMA